MTRLIELTDSIDSAEIGRTLSGQVKTGWVKLELEGIGQQVINIVSTPSNLQGLIRWATCPNCNRRIKKLYLPPDSEVFLCRKCYSLGYRTQYDRTFRKTPYKSKRALPETKRERLHREAMLKYLKKCTGAAGLRAFAGGPYNAPLKYSKG
jgi:hypothetical protein